jgi:hypothetical protein
MRITPDARRKVVTVDSSQRVDPRVSILLAGLTVAIPVPVIQPWLLCHRSVSLYSVVFRGSIPSSSSLFHYNMRVKF